MRERNDIISLSGTYQVRLGAEESYTHTVTLPGTLDEHRVGTPDNQRHERRLSRYVTYTGAAWYQREVTIPEGFADGSVTLTLERSRLIRLWINGEEVTGGKPEGTLPICHTYEVSRFLKAGERNTITILVDNAYEELPATAILYSSTATDETQTNWNGVLGEMSLKRDAATYLSALRIYPLDSLDGIRAELDIATVSEGTVSGSATLSVGEESVVVPYEITTKGTVAAILKLNHPRLWSEHDPYLYEAAAVLDTGSKNRVSFGLRSIRTESSRFTVNGTPVFFRNEANCGVFPLTGYAPMEEKDWEKLFAAYQSYGLNSVRFHSWCPPEAAFAVADRMGLYLFPELSCWNPWNMFAEEKERCYYEKEAFAILKAYASHPSFLSLSFGNELIFGGEGSDAFADDLLRRLKEADPTRLYIAYSNGNYGRYAPLPHADFFTGQVYRGTPMRGIFAGMSGFINQEHPSTMPNYDEAVNRAKTECGKPIYSFEVGQFQVFPDLLKEVSRYTGVLEPRNFHLVEEQAEKQGLTKEQIEQYINASGRLSQLGYRMELEAALRTRNFGGISLLGIQDFSGQGTALVGMMNALGDAKPYPFANPKEFRQWCSPVVVLLELPRFCYEAGETLFAKALVANYGADSITAAASYRFETESGTLLVEGTIPMGTYEKGELSPIGAFTISLNGITTAVKCTLTISLDTYQNTYPIWVYPSERVEIPRNIHIAESLDETALAVLEQGGSVLLSPIVGRTTLPKSITGTFTAAFWSSTFVSEAQPGSMGLLMNPEHPVFRRFPTEFHTNFQWWPMAKLGRPMVLEEIVDEKGEKLQPLVQVIDSFAQIRTMGLLFEARVGNGKLMVSSMGLTQTAEKYPEARALLSSILDYMTSEAFAPDAVLTPEQVMTLVQARDAAERPNLAERSNGGTVLLGEGTYTCQDGYDKDPQDRTMELNDGIADTTEWSRSWTDWNPKRHYPDVSMTITMNDTYVVDTLALAFYGDDKTKAPGAVVVTYFNGTDYVPVSLTGETASLGSGICEISFAPVATNRLCVTMSHRDNQALAVSEVMVYPVPNKA